MVAVNLSVDISNARFGSLTAMSQSGWHIQSSGRRMPIWRCKCDCGSELDVRKTYLTSGDTKSCGCLRRRTTASLKMKHGMAHKSSTYDIWVLMRQRCNNPRANGFRYYGGRGVTVCERWDDYANFLSDMGERPTGLTLDRRDPYGNYEPSNCRWETWTVQNNNKRTHALVDNDMRRMTL